MLVGAHRLDQSGSRKWLTPRRRSHTQPLQDHTAKSASFSEVIFTDWGSGRGLRPTIFTKQYIGSWVVQGSNISEVIYGITTFRIYEIMQYGNGFKQSQQQTEQICCPVRPAYLYLCLCMRNRTVANTPLQARGALVERGLLLRAWPQSGWPSVNMP